ncbi:MAG: glycosyltransferase family 8 protein [Butyrivibrio sp.]|nr:glycosyltransferase family 8 protein [Butyrivibrio sp.]
MATDNRYIPLIVSITSMIENAGKDTFYDIYILIDDSFTQESELAVKNCLCGFGERCSLSFQNVGHVFNNAFITISHITRPTYYRLMIPDLLSEDKCIYLDTDTIILSDLQELFNTPLDASYIAGVWHPGVILYEWEDAICKNANIPSADQYINAGVLVMNLKELRQDGMVGKFLELMQLNMPSQDQDVINNACYGKIALLPFKYNVMTKLADMRIEDYKGGYSEEELKEAWNKPCIIHYADLYKPWNSSECVFMDYWWKFFRKSLIYEYDSIMNEFWSEFVQNIIYNPKNSLLFTKRTPQIFDLAFKRNYVIYGAGKRAREVISYMKRLNIIPELIIVSNVNENPLDIEGIEVKGIMDVCQILYDKTIVISVQESQQKDIIKNLQQYDYLELLPISDKFLM